MFDETLSLDFKTNRLESGVLELRHFRVTTCDITLFRPSQCSLHMFTKSRTGEERNTPMLREMVLNFQRDRACKSGNVL